MMPGEGGGVYLIGGEPVHQFTLAVITHALHEKHHFPFLYFSFLPSVKLLVLL